MPWILQTAHGADNSMPTQAKDSCALQVMGEGYNTPHLKKDERISGGTMALDGVSIDLHIKSNR